MLKQNLRLAAVFAKRTCRGFLFVMAPQLIAAPLPSYEELCAQFPTVDLSFDHSERPIVIDRSPNVKVDESDFKCFSITSKMPTEDVIAAMDQAGYAPATFNQLLTWSKLNPDLPSRAHYVVALGSVAVISYMSFYKVPCLTNTIGCSRGLSLMWGYDREWSDVSNLVTFLFLGVRKSS